MCSSPKEKDGNTFACRSCDECVATRRHGWVARAMAEKTDHKHTVCLTLTYSDETQASRDAAAMFCYADVQAFLKRLRDALRRSGCKSGVRFLCAGEQGDRYGRCHWHLILFSNTDLTTIGKFRLRGHFVTHRRDMITEGKRKRRLNWSLWEHGFVTVQEPSQAGMNYVLSYCLKDQFTEEKSRGTMREAKSENFATGLFRMSKYPAIGENFLMRKLEALEASGSVLPSLKIKIPEFGGYWQPNGLFRKKLLWGLNALNKRSLWAKGVPAPQWPALLSSCADNETDLGVLNGQPRDEGEESFELEYSKRQRYLADEKRRAKTRRLCGAEVACDTCLNFVEGRELAGYGLERFEDEDGWWQYRSTPGHDSIHQRRQRDGNGVNPLCGKRGTLAIRDAFPRSGLDGPCP